jgi:hypothetical protein
MRNSFVRVQWHGESTMKTNIYAPSGSIDAIVAAPHYSPEYPARPDHELPQQQSTADVPATGHQSNLSTSY